MHCVVAGNKCPCSLVVRLTDELTRQSFKPVSVHVCVCVCVCVCVEVLLKS